MDEKLNDTTHAVSSNPEYHGSREIYAMRLTVLISQHNTAILFKLSVTVSVCRKPLLTSASKLLSGCCPLLRMFFLFSPSSQILLIISKPFKKDRTVTSSFLLICATTRGPQQALVSTFSVGDPGSIPGSGRSSGEGNGNPLQYPCLENPMDGGAWWATVSGVTKSQTRLRNFTFTFRPLIHGY